MIEKGPSTNKDIHKDLTEKYAVDGFFDDIKNFFLNNEFKNNITLIQKLIKLKSFFHNTKFENPDYLAKIKHKIEAVNSPLTASPKKPMHQEIDKGQAEKYIAQFADKGFQETARKIIFDGYITYISFQDFENSLFQAMQKFHQHLLINNIDPNSLSAFIEKHHSSEWVASLAVKYLKFCPKKYNEISDNKFVLDISSLKKGTHNFVIFDDWCITGTQIKNYINDIQWKIDRAQLYSKEKFNGKLNLICVVPLITPIAFETLSNYQKNNISLKIITDKFIPTIKSLESILSETDFNNLMRIVQDGEDQILAFSDWKVPDFVSMSTAISEGNIPWELTRYKGMRIDQVPPEANRNRFIPSVKPPYHK